jgi:RNA polymerase sigma factor (TIGR02999 family)
MMNIHITGLLHRLESGSRDAIDELMPLVYTELKKLARRHLRREASRASLDTTSLVHEAFLKLAGTRHPTYENRSHFYGIVSRLMRQVLVDTARHRGAEKRNAANEVSIAELPDAAPQPSRSVLAVNDALKQLEISDPGKSELIEMSYFGGFTAEEISRAVSKPVHIVRRELRLAKAWLRMEMSGNVPDRLNA